MGVPLITNFFGSGRRGRLSRGRGRRWRGRHHRRPEPRGNHPGRSEPKNLVIRGTPIFWKKSLGVHPFFFPKNKLFCRKSAKIANLDDIIVVAREGGILSELILTHFKNTNLRTQKIPSWLLQPSVIVTVISELSVYPPHMGVISGIFSNSQEVR